MSRRGWNGWFTIWAVSGWHDRPRAGAGWIYLRHPGGHAVCVVATAGFGAYKMKQQRRDRPEAPKPSFSGTFGVAKRASS